MRFGRLKALNLISFACAVDLIEYATVLPAAEHTRIRLMMTLGTRRDVAGAKRQTLDR